LTITRFGYLDGYCCSLIGVSICWAAAEADTQYTIFDLSALKKQCFIFWRSWWNT
jgi:hypothetical protein